MKYRFPLLTIALLGTIVTRGAAADLVEIRVNGHYFAEPATVLITIAVEPDQANRRLRVQADGDAFFRSTEVPLEGDSEKRIHVVEFKNLPAGAYELRAEVLSSSAVLGTATQEMEVMGSAR